MYPIDFTQYISNKTTFFQKYNCKDISKRIFVILGPEEAEIFKDYFFLF